MRDNIKNSSTRLCLILCSLVFLAPLFITGKTKAETERDKTAIGGKGIVIVEDFSKPAIYGPNQWKHLYFPRIKRHTMYNVVTGEGKGYLRAESSASASAIYRRLDLDLTEYPILSWKWKIDGVLKKGDARAKAGDDYAARIYVTFAHDPAKTGYLAAARRELTTRFFGLTPPASALNYIWANRLARESIAPNAYTGRNMMIALESGNERTGQWVREERNVYEDYIKAFGHKPPPLTGLAIMTDSDNTGDSATGYYAEIVFRKKPSLK